jgi:TrmH family RNA methyltransferase
MGIAGNTNEVVTSRSNARVKQLRAAFAGLARLSGELVAIEGDNLLGEAVRSGMMLKTIFVSERRELPGFVPRSVEVLWLCDDVFASVVETQSPQGIAALLVPPVRSLDEVIVEKPLILVAAGLQDPGNLGTLVRSAEAFGASGVVTTPGTVSAWNQKALRASAGSVFRIPVIAATVEELRSLKTRGVTLMAAVPEDSDRAIAACDADFDGATAILIGNEGAGLGEELLALADVRVTIPCPGKVESLNAAVAGSLLLYEASRRRGSQMWACRQTQIPFGDDKQVKLKI